MNMPNFDDGFDLFAPPTPEGSPEHPPKLCDDEEGNMLWLVPIAALASTGVNSAWFYGAFTPS
jgi:hypothetical protein